MWLAQILAPGLAAAGCCWVLLACCDSSAGCNSCCSRKRGCRMKSKSKKKKVIKRGGCYGEAADAGLGRVRAFPFDLLASFCSSISPSLSCSACPALPACLRWELELPGWKGKRPVRVGGLQVVGRPRSACAEAASQGSGGRPGRNEELGELWLQTPCAGIRANPLQVIVSRQSGFGNGSKERGGAFECASADGRRAAIIM